MTSLIRSYLILTVIMTILCALVPNDKMKRYIGFFSGLILSAGILVSFSDIAQNIGLLSEESDIKKIEDIVELYDKGAGDGWMKDEVEQIIEGIVLETEELKEE